MIRLENVTVRRGQNEVLHHLSAEIPSASITAVVGRSGVGKSTLLGVLNGLIRPVSGQVSVAGMAAMTCPVSLREYRRRTATVFQEHALIDRLPAIDNVLLGLADRRHPLSPLPWSNDMRSQAAVALNEVGLLHRATARADRLSGGERQRVGVARALVRKPSLLLGDEPFASVDPALVGQIGDMLREQVARNGMTVVLVMHQIETALALSDKVIGLVNGEVAYDGPACEFDTEAQERIFSM
ncbi:MAG: ATP-binding cassette domain-containing protein [Parasulfuritortus sp.]|jgi:phosphonate transport system ATP-binding protein|nr:ATP-binding cassette domain-containing protein [Parasulfuritortus sp.]